MKLARFRVDDWESYGVVEGDRVRVIQGSIFGEHRFTQASYALDRVKLLPPTRPTSFWAVGLNYAAHIAHQEGALDAERIRREASVFRPFLWLVCSWGSEPGGAAAVPQDTGSPVRPSYPAAPWLESSQSWHPPLA